MAGEAEFTGELNDTLVDKLLGDDAAAEAEQQALELRTIREDGAVVPVQPEGQPEGEQQPEGAPPVDKMVPHQALHEERKRRQELQKQVQIMNDRFQQFVARTMERQQPQQQPAPPPDFEQDPLGHIKHKLDQTDHRLTQQQQFEQQRAQAEQQRAWQQQIVSNLARQEQQFKQQAPDYQEALAFLQQRKTAELEALGRGPEEIEQYFTNEAFNLAVHVAQTGQNGAQLVYNLAKAMGYTPKQARQMQQNAQKLDNIQRGVPQSKSAQGGTGTVSLEQIASMSDEDFDKLTSGDGWRKIMGG